MFKVKSAINTFKKPSPVSSGISFVSFRHIYPLFLKRNTLPAEGGMRRRKAGLGLLEEVLMNRIGRQSVTELDEIRYAFF